MKKGGIVFEIDELLDKATQEIIQELQDEGEKPTKEKIKKKQIEKEVTNSSFLKKIASEKLNRYIKDTNQFKVLDTQVKLIADEILKYKSVPEIFEKNSERLKALTTLKNEFTKSIRYSTISQDRKKAVNIAINSPEIKKLKKDLDDLRKDLKKLQPNSLYKLLVEYRRRIELTFNPKQKSNLLYDFEDDSYQVIENSIDEDLSNQEIDIRSKYAELIKHISKLIGEDMLTIEGMSAGAILKKLKEKSQEEEIVASTESLKNRILDKEIEIKMMISEVAGDKTTKIIFDNFDLSDENDLYKATEILASSRASYVLAIANVLCKKYNCEKYIDDVVGFGLLALSVAINKWKTFQKISNIPINFDLFLGINLTGPMVKGIYELNQTGGMIHHSVAIKNDYKRKEDIDNFINDNPELKNIPYDQAISVYNYMLYEKHGGKKSNFDYANPNVSTETDFRNTIGGMVNDETAEMFSNMLRDDSTETLIDERFEHKEIINSIKTFFTTYKKAIDKKTGNFKITNKLYFDKWDLKILELSMNMVPNPYKNGGNWDQESIAKELTKLRKEEDGGSFTQGSISIRINDFTKKLREMGKHYPKLQSSIEFFIAYFASSRGDNMKSEKGLSDVMSQIYSGISQMKTITKTI